MKYRNNENGKIYSASSPADLPTGTFVQVSEATPVTPGCSCIPCAGGAGIAPTGDVAGNGMRVDSQAICDLPGNEPINCSFTPCLKGIFVDCYFALWSTDPYTGTVYCRPSDTGWTAAKLDRCPSIKSRLYYDATSRSFWALIDGAYFLYNSETGWGQYTGVVPTCLSPVFWNAATGEYVYYAAVTEIGQRNVISGVPFCTGTV